MSTPNAAAGQDPEKNAASIHSINQQNDANSNDDGGSNKYIGAGDGVELLSSKESDPIMANKMHLVNNVCEKSSNHQKCVNHHKV